MKIEFLGSYTSCIRREAGYCTICYQASTDTNSFQTDSSPGIATGGSGTTSCPANIARLWIPDSNVGGMSRRVTLLISLLGNICQSISARAGETSARGNL